MNENPYIYISEERKKRYNIIYERKHIQLFCIYIHIQQHLDKILRYLKAVHLFEGIIKVV